MFFPCASGCPLAMVFMRSCVVHTSGLIRVCRSRGRQARFVHEHGELLVGAAQMAEVRGHLAVAQLEEVQREARRVQRRSQLVGHEREVSRRGLLELLVAQPSVCADRFRGAARDQPRQDGRIRVAGLLAPLGEELEDGFGDGPGTPSASARCRSRW